MRDPDRISLRQLADRNDTEGISLRQLADRNDTEGISLRQLADRNDTGMGRQYFVYILTNRHHTVFYTGVTSDLVQRIYQHKNKLVDGFTKRYNVSELMYYEVLQVARGAIEREKQIKDYRREKKMVLINKMNPEWKDLYEGISHPK